GISANVNGIKVSIGSYKFIYQKEISEEFNLQTRVYYSVEGVIKGYFAFKNKYREGLKETIQALRTDYDISLLSGDNESERNNLLEFFDSNSQLLFGQSPFDKLEFVKKLQSENKYVLMIGDGLNDAGALKQSNVGISLSEDINNFSPACDGIMEAKSFNKLKDFISFSRVSKKIIIISFIVSFLYNLIGLAFAVQGQLSPVIAAILMPISSISVVVFTTLATNFMAKRHGLLQWK
ncbi:MAG: heavy metal translocating P-type ATPase, partial [Ignavibacteriae bacterium HGW-Ignavibacteriae-2]